MLIKRPLALIGFPCSGKTTLGQLLANELKRPWLDSDEEITRSSGQTPGYWLQTAGEPVFRRIEREWLQNWQPVEACVLSTGGGLPCYQDNLSLLKQKALTVYLDLDFTTLLVRLQTPPGHALTRLFDVAGLEALYQRRQEIYSQAELRLDASKQPEEILAALLTSLKELA